MDAPFISEFRPEHGQAQCLAEGIRRVVAPNPSPLTFKGTNTYVIGTREPVVIDPGPNLDSHLEAIFSAIPPGRQIRKILLTHAHLDHSEMAPRLAEHTGAKICAFGDYSAERRDVHLIGASFANSGFEEGVDKSFKPDIRIKDGEKIRVDDWKINAIWTPGHLGNHLCFDISEARILFSGDHVMTWATTVVSPPSGNMTDYLASLEKLISRGQRKLLPGHGAEHADGLSVMNHLMAHRRSRERQILEALDDRQLSAAQIADQIYTDLSPSLRPAASMNVLAHLLDLRRRGIVEAEGGSSADSAFRRLN